MKAQSGGRVPFSNGTEGRAWESAWCSHCRHDHDMTHPGGTENDGCDLMLAAMVETDRLPEGWLDVPEGYGYHLPSHMVCLKFQPCTEGSCEGDPQAQARADQVAHVQRAWGQTPVPFPTPVPPVQLPGQLDVFGNEVPA